MPLHPEAVSTKRISRLDSELSARTVRPSRCRLKFRRIPSRVWWDHGRAQVALPFSSFPLAPRNRPVFPSLRGKRNTLRRRSSRIVDITEVMARRCTSSGELSNNPAKRLAETGRAAVQFGWGSFRESLTSTERHDYFRIARDTGAIRKMDISKKWQGARQVAERSHVTFDGAIPWPLICIWPRSG